jgi:hypothetical protein
MLENRLFNLVRTNTVATCNDDIVSPTVKFKKVVLVVLAEVTIEAVENDLVVVGGRLLVSRHVHLGSDELPISQSELRSALSSLKGEALVALRRAGLDEFQLPRYPTLSEEVFASLLLRRTGPASIGVMVLDDVYRSGPADLELVVLD